MSIQNVKVARFARNVEWDFFFDFQTLCCCCKAQFTCDGNINFFSQLPWAGCHFAGIIGTLGCVDIKNRCHLVIRFEKIFGHGRPWNCPNKKGWKNEIEWSLPTWPRPMTPKVLSCKLDEEEEANRTKVPPAPGNHFVHFSLQCANISLIPDWIFDGSKRRIFSYTWENIVTSAQYKLATVSKSYTKSNQENRLFCHRFRSYGSKERSEHNNTSSIWYFHLVMCGIEIMYLRHF